MRQGGHSIEVQLSDVYQGLHSLISANTSILPAGTVTSQGFAHCSRRQPICVSETLTQLAPQLSPRYININAKLHVQPSGQIPITLLSVRKSESRMIITKIIELVNWQAKSTVALAGIALLVLAHDQQEKSDCRKAAEPDQA